MNYIDVYNMIKEAADLRTLTKKPTYRLASPRRNTKAPDWSAENEAPPSDFEAEQAERGYTKDQSGNYVLNISRRHTPESPFAVSSSPFMRQLEEEQRKWDDAAYAHVADLNRQRIELGNGPMPMDMQMRGFNNYMQNRRNQVVAESRQRQAQDQQTAFNRIDTALNERQKHLDTSRYLQSRAGAADRNRLQRQLDKERSASYNMSGAPQYRPPLPAQSAYQPMSQNDIERQQNNYTGSALRGNTLRMYNDTRREGEKGRDIAAAKGIGQTRITSLTPGSNGGAATRINGIATSTASDPSLNREQRIAANNLTRGERGAMTGSFKDTSGNWYKIKGTPGGNNWSQKDLNELQGRYSTDSKGKLVTPGGGVNTFGGYKTLAEFNGARRRQQNAQQPTSNFGTFAGLKGGPTMRSNALGNSPFSRA